MRTAKILFVLALLWLPSAGFAEAAEEEAPQKHFLWKITGGDGVVYLLGTVHVGKAELYPLPDIIEQSFKKADKLVEEIDATDAAESGRMIQLLLKNGVCSDDDTLDNHLTEATRAHLAEYLKEHWVVGLLIPSLKPWAASALIAALQLQSAGYDASLGLDVHFLEEAKKLHKPIGALETVEFQIELLSSLPDDVQDALLLGSLLDAEDYGQFSGQLLHAWQSGDVDRMEALVDRSVRDYPQLAPLMKKLLDERNTGMANQIEQFLRNGETVFVAVGAGHLVGDHGLLSLLRARSFSIEQL